jgi:hypothetical protein
MEILLHDHKRGLSEVATTPLWRRHHGQKADVDGMFVLGILNYFMS